MTEYFRWVKLKGRDIFRAEKLLRDMEADYVSACGRFLTREQTGASVWTLLGKKGEMTALAINSRSTVMPVLCGKTDVPKPFFLKGFWRQKKVHSVQGLKEEVAVFEKVMEQIGRKTTDLFDYDLMSLDKLPIQKNYSGALNVILRVPQLTDLDAMAPLQVAYEQEEVLPKGSVFSALASRTNLANIIAQKQILAAEVDGRLVGKINISAVSFTRYQVGGVYVHPDFRKLGIARLMAAEFTASLINQGRGVTLFVKKNNLAARKLYTGLGFSTRNNYRITYY